MGRARAVAKDLESARAALSIMAAPGAKIDKKMIKDALKEVEGAAQILKNSIPWVVEQAQEAVDAAVNHGKAELNAYAEHELGRIGRQALAERLSIGGEGVGPLRIEAFKSDTDPGSC